MDDKRNTPPLALVVDDDPTIRLIATRTLEVSGLRVVSAKTGEDGVDLFEREHPDVVLMDVMMPGIDGYEAVRRLRTSASGRHVPVLMLTGLDDLESINRAYEAGATDFISKPINWGVLGHRVRYILRAAEAFASMIENQALLASAQRVARLGSWRWDLVSNRMQWSEEAFRILGYEPGEVAATLEAMLARVHPDDAEELRDTLDSLRAAGGGREAMHRMLLADGSVRYVRFHSDVMLSESGEPLQAFGAIQDVTEHKAAEERIHELAYFDRLTRLPNRHWFVENVEAALQQAQRSGRLVAVLTLDLDQFKRINDTLGHSVGDQLLAAVAERLRSAIVHRSPTGRASATEEIGLARVGGDEFCVLLTRMAQFQDAARVAEEILDSLRRPVEVGGRELFITASIGIAMYPLDGEDADALLKNADAAMYFAKSQGRNNYQFYGKEMNSRAMERLALESRLRRAIQRGEFELYYQPKIDLRTNEVAGAEALIRWRHPELGMVPPMQFIPIAEDSGLIIPIGEWVLHQAAAQLRKWQLDGVPITHVAVNIASPHFQQAEFTEHVASVLRETGLPPQGLELEVTESMLMDDQRGTLATLTQLKAMGLRLAIDDFGTGYSSLSYLKRFPVDALKVDRSFVKDTPQADDDSAITSAIIAMAHSLRLEVVAEGVETPEQLEFLRGRGCEYIQGFLVSRPLPPAEFEKFIRNRIPAVSA